MVFGLGATSDDETSVSVNISGPMGSSGGYRISAFDRDRSDGHIKNLTTGDDVNGQESSGVRGRFDFSLSDDLMATLTVEHTESESNCCHRPYRDVPAGANFLGAVPGAFALGPVSPSDDNDEVAVDDATTDESESDMVSLRLESEWGDHQFVSVTSHTTWDYDVSTDVDPAPRLIYWPPSRVAHCLADSFRGVVLSSNRRRRNSGWYRLHRMASNTLLGSSTPTLATTVILRVDRFSPQIG